MNALTKTFGFQGGFEHRDVLFAVGIVAILAVLFLPVPAWVLDLGLAVSLSLSVLILMVALWINKPLDFSSFPTILLVATTLRLALNIASTRLILSQGHTGSDAAGGVIQGFSQFLMSGNFVIGLIVFAILVVVNFVVITKGATRIAEVGARFTLDAIPGKQMAIDADLSAGLIDDQQARDRRKSLEDESSFFGAMDGASKFVRGDAVAGMIITFINIIGGMVIGVVQMGLPAGEAATAYTMLTVGDGLASQVPAVIVSLSAGMLVAKGGNTGSTEQAVLSQLGNYPKALLVLAGLLVTLALIPGLPFMPFVALGAFAGSLAYLLPKRRAAAVLRAEEAEKAKGAETASEDKAEDALKVEDVQLEVCSQLLPLIQYPEKGLSPKVKSLRRRFAKEYGFLLPPVRIRDNVYVPPGEYRVSIQDIERARGSVHYGRVMVIDPTGGKVDIPGEADKEPTFGMPAVWVDPARAEEAEAKGFTVVDCESVITTHLAETIKDNLPALLTYGALQRLLDNLSPEYTKLLGDLVPGQISMVVLQRVLQSLLAERISIRNLPVILEAVSEAVTWTRNITMIVEHVRSRLAPQICSMLTGPDGFVPVISLSPEWDEAFIQAIVQRDQDRSFAMAPSKVNEFVKQARAKIQAHATPGSWPAVLAAPDARPFVRSLLERISPMTPVISHNELHSKATVKTVDQI